MEQLTGLGQGLFKLGTLGGFGAATYAAVFSPSAANISTACATAAAFTIGSGFFNRRREKAELAGAVQVAGPGSESGSVGPSFDATSHEKKGARRDADAPTIEIPTARITIATLEETHRYGCSDSASWRRAYEPAPPRSPYAASYKRRGGFLLLVAVFVLAAVAGLIARFW
jgi:hypothetical protein